MGSVILAKKYIDLLKKGLEIVIISKENFMMAGCLDNVRLGVPEWLEVGNRRNIVASILSGLLFFGGWWFAIDAAAVHPDKEQLKDVFHICGVFGTLSFFMVNAVSNGQLRGESFTEGCLGVRGARIWFFFGLLMGFGSLIGASWILFGEYIAQVNHDSFKPDVTYPGVAIFLQNSCIFIASLVFKFGRVEDNWN